MATSYVLHDDSGGIIGSKALLNTVPNVNFKNTGFTTLFTVPAGKQFILDDIRSQPTNVTGLTVEPDFTAGCNNPTYDDWAAGYTLFQSATNNDTSLRNLIITNGVYVFGKVYQAGDVLKFQIDTPATATTYLATLRVFGILF